MSRANARRLSYGRALVVFVAAYVVISALAFGLYLIVAAGMGVHMYSTFSVRKDAAYLLCEKLYPVLNLVIWTVSAWIYFRKEVGSAGSIVAALKLGGFWLLVALPLDLIVFVLIPTPLSLSAPDFYVSQFPWIYFTYVALFAGPFVYASGSRLRIR